MVSVEEVADVLHSAAAHVLRRGAEPGTAITPARLSALFVVAGRGPLTVGALAAAEGVRSPTMSGIVNGLERDGLVSRRTGAADRRATLVRATPAGKRLLARERRRRTAVVAASLGDLAPRELLLLWRAGQLLEDRLAPEPEEPARGSRRGTP